MSAQEIELKPANTGCQILSVGFGFFVPIGLGVGILRLFPVGHEAAQPLIVLLFIVSLISAVLGLFWARGPACSLTLGESLFVNFAGRCEAISAEAERVNLHVSGNYTTMKYRALVIASKTRKLVIIDEAHCGRYSSKLFDNDRTLKRDPTHSVTSAQFKELLHSVFPTS